MNQGVIKFKLAGRGFKIPNSKNRPIEFMGTFKEVEDEMKRIYHEAGSPKYSYVIATYYGCHQMRFPNFI